MRRDPDWLGLEHYRYLSRRLPVMATQGMVATSEPLAAQAGLRCLQRGGNAVDAALTTAIALTVLEPTCNGIGGDAAVLVWDGGRMHGLNGSGRAPAAMTRESLTSRGLKSVPSQGWPAVTVPGTPAAWRDLHQRFGRLPFEALFEPAIDYATRGFPVSPVTALRWQAVAAIHAAGAGDDPALRPWRETFTRDGRPPRAGELWTLPDFVPTLRELASTGCESFYRGRLARRIAEFAGATGGCLAAGDLAKHESSWVDPIQVSYRGHQVWQLPPSGQGIAALTALKILEGFSLPQTSRDSVESYHLQIEAIKSALEDAYQYIADPDVVPVAWPARLEEEFAAEKRRRLRRDGTTSSVIPNRLGGTVYLCAADADGMMVSLMQSNYTGWLLGFGSGVVVPGSGIALHSRACGFTLEETHPNVLAPGKRPFHTLAPSFLTRAGRPLGPFGIIGGPLQTQAQVQFIVNELDYGMNPQENLDAPRFQWTGANRVEVELSVPGEVMQGLVARGHEIHPCVEFAAVPPRLTGSLGSGGLVACGDFGKAQMIRRQDDGVYVAASDWRAGGCAAGY